MSTNEQQGLRAQSEIWNDERGMRNNGKSAIHNPQYRQADTQHSALSTQHSIEVHVEELVLNGFAPGDRYRIAEAVERELTRLFVDQGMSPSLIQGGDIARLDGGGFRVTSDSHAETIGTQIAQTVYGSFHRLSRQ